MTRMNTQVRLARRPNGWVEEGDFEVVTTEVPTAGPGQVLVKNLFLSLDPYMRGRMSEARSYAPPVELGQVMVGGTVGRVVASNLDGLAPGDTVVGSLGWQAFALSEGKGLTRIDVGRGLPLSAYLGAVGMPGVTAWYGLYTICDPKPGETVLVSAASGAVGSVVGQLARFRGCRVVGIAGGQAKCDYVVKELGFDACVDHRAGDLDGQLRAAAPEGIDVDFENVGGEVMEAVVRRLNPFARIALCGRVSQYNELQPRGLQILAALLTNRVKLQGFIITDHLDIWPQALRELGGWVAEGKLKFRETIVEGLENAPRAFIGLLKGENFGKLVVRLAD